MEVLLVNAVGKVRRVRENGRDYFVAPMTLICPGVLNGSKGALWYPKEEVAKNPSVWNNTPLVVYHPNIAGKPVSASAPGVWEKSGIGRVRNARFKDKLIAEGWFDAERTRRIDRRVYDALVNGEPIELSTGLYTDNEPARNGATCPYTSRQYTHIARNYRPDHLAILPDQVGACSIQDGCGVLVNSNSAPYGYCPICGAPGEVRERRLNGDTICKNGHKYPSKESILEKPTENKEGPFKFCSTQLNLSPADAKRVKALHGRIADSDLGEEGLETEPHVTVKYGIHSDDADKVQRLVEGFGPVTVRLGRLSSFRTAGKPDVLKIDVVSPALRRLNRLLSSNLKVTDTFDAYRPHVTVAYLKEGSARKYVGTHPLEGEELTFSKLQFSNKEGGKTTLSLNASGENCGTGAGGFQPGNTCGRDDDRELSPEGAGVGGVLGGALGGAALGAVTGGPLGATAGLLAGGALGTFGGAKLGKQVGKAGADWLRKQGEELKGGLRQLGQGAVQFAHGATDILKSDAVFYPAVAAGIATGHPAATVVGLGALGAKAGDWLDRRQAKKNARKKLKLEKNIAAKLGAPLAGSTEARSLIQEAATRNAFDPSQPRDDDGKWTSISGPSGPRDSRKQYLHQPSGHGGAAWRGNTYGHDKGVKAPIERTGMSRTLHEEFEASEGALKPTQEAADATQQWLDNFGAQFLGPERSSIRSWMNNAERLAGQAAELTDKSFNEEDPEESHKSRKNASTNHITSRNVHRDIANMLEDKFLDIQGANSTNSQVRRLIKLHRDAAALHHDAAQMLVGNAFDPSQPRDSQGKWTEISGGSEKARGNTNLSRMIDDSRGAERVGTQLWEEMASETEGEVLRAVERYQEEGEENTRYNEAGGRSGFVPLEAYEDNAHTLKDLYPKLSKEGELTKRKTLHRELSEAHKWLAELLRELPRTPVIGRHIKLHEEAAALHHDADESIVSNAFDPSQPRDEDGKWRAVSGHTKRQASLERDSIHSGLSRRPASSTFEEDLEAAKGGKLASHIAQGNTDKFVHGLEEVRRSGGGQGRRWDELESIQHDASRGGEYAWIAERLVTEVDLDAGFHGSKTFTNREAALSYFDSASTRHDKVAKRIRRYFADVAGAEKLAKEHDEAAALLRDAANMMQDSGYKKVDNFDPSQPRDNEGQWTAVGGRNLTGRPTDKTWGQTLYGMAEKAGVAFGAVGAGLVAGRTLLAGAETAARAAALPAGAYSPVAALGATGTLMAVGSVGLLAAPLIIGLATQGRAGGLLTEDAYEELKDVTEAMFSRLTLGAGPLAVKALVAGAAYSPKLFALLAEGAQQAASGVKEGWKAATRNEMSDEQIKTQLPPAWYELGTILRDRPEEIPGFVKGLKAALAAYEGDWEPIGNARPFDESKYKRDDGGRFSETQGGGGAVTQPAKAPRSPTAQDVAGAPQGNPQRTAAPASTTATATPTPASPRQRITDAEGGATATFIKEALTANPVTLPVGAALSAVPGFRSQADKEAQSEAGEVFKGIFSRMTLGTGPVAVKAVAAGVRHSPQLFRLLMRGLAEAKRGAVAAAGAIGEGARQAASYIPPKQGRDKAAERAERKSKEAAIAGDTEGAAKWKAQAEEHKYRAKTWAPLPARNEELLFVNREYVRDKNGKFAKSGSGGEVTPEGPKKKRKRQKGEARTPDMAPEPDAATHHKFKGGLAGAMAGMLLGGAAAGPVGAVAGGALGMFGGRWAATPGSREQLKKTLGLNAEGEIPWEQLPAGPEGANTGAYRQPTDPDRADGDTGKKDRSTPDPFEGEVGLTKLPPSLALLARILKRHPDMLPRLVEASKAALGVLDQEEGREEEEQFQGQVQDQPAGPAEQEDNVFPAADEPTPEDEEKDMLRSVENLLHEDRYPLLTNDELGVSAVFNSDKDRLLAYAVMNQYAWEHGELVANADPFDRNVQLSLINIGETLVANRVPRASTRDDDDDDGGGGYGRGHFFSTCDRNDRGWCLSGDVEKHINQAIKSRIGDRIAGKIDDRISSKFDRMIDAAIEEELKKRLPPEPAPIQQKKVSLLRRAVKKLIAGTAGGTAGAMAGAKLGSLGGPTGVLAGAGVGGAAGFAAGLAGSKNLGKLAGYIAKKVGGGVGKLATSPKALGAATGAALLGSALATGGATAVPMAVASGVGAVGGAVAGAKFAKFAKSGVRKAGEASLGEQEKLRAMREKNQAKYKAEAQAKSQPTTQPAKATGTFPKTFPTKPGQLAAKFPPAGDDEPAFLPSKHVTEVKSILKGMSPPSSGLPSLGDVGKRQAVAAAVADAVELSSKVKVRSRVGKERAAEAHTRAAEALDAAGDEALARMHRQMAEELRASATKRRANKNNLGEPPNTNAEEGLGFLDDPEAVDEMVRAATEIERRIQEYEAKNFEVDWDPKWEPMRTTNASISINNRSTRRKFHPIGRRINKTLIGNQLTLNCNGSETCKPCSRKNRKRTAGNGRTWTPLS